MGYQVQDIVIDANHSRADKLVLEQMCRDIAATKDGEDSSSSYKTTLETLKALNNPQDARFEPTVFTTWDMDDIRSSPRVPGFLLRLLEEYITWARKVARNETDVVMVTHLLLYFCTSIPSAIILFTRFTYLHAFGHIAMQFYYMGPYTLLKHQHIHQRGVLAKRFGVIDNLFPYAMDLFMGHTWNSYFYHHVKHHHVEGNGPNDMSSTIRYQRDSVLDFSIYIGRFLFFVWIDLPRYFLVTGKYALASKAAFWELGAYAFYYSLFQINPRATAFVFLVPLCVMRIAMMVGNWGQHAFVDADEPDSDYRSSITVIDVPSNRYCYNDGYHTSHHLNPMRHWREHPVHFLEAKPEYARQQAIVFHNIDYNVISFSLLTKNYMHLAKCLVPIGEKQINMTMDERVTWLKRHTRRFTEEEIRKKFKMPTK